MWTILEVPNKPLGFMRYKYKDGKYYYAIKNPKTLNYEPTMSADEKPFRIYIKSLVANHPKGKVYSSADGSNNSKEDVSKIIDIPDKANVGMKDFHVEQSLSEISKAAYDVPSFDTKGLTKAQIDAKLKFDSNVRDNETRKAKQDEAIKKDYAAKKELAIENINKEKKGIYKSITPDFKIEKKVEVPIIESRLMPTNTPYEIDQKRKRVIEENYERIAKESGKTVEQVKKESYENQAKSLKKSEDERIAKIQEDNKKRISTEDKKRLEDKRIAKESLDKVQKSMGITPIKSEEQIAKEKEDEFNIKVKLADEDTRKKTQALQIENDRLKKEVARNESNKAKPVTSTKPVIIQNNNTTTTSNNSNMNPDNDGIVYNDQDQAIEKFVKQLDGSYKIIPFNANGQLDLVNAKSISEVDFKPYIQQRIATGNTTDNAKINYNIITNQPNYNDTPTPISGGPVNIIQNTPSIVNNNQNPFTTNNNTIVNDPNQPSDFNMYEDDLFGNSETPVKIYDKEGKVTGQYVIQDDNTYIYKDINDPNWNQPRKNDSGKKMTNAELQELIKDNAAKGGKTDVEFDIENENNPFFEKIGPQERGHNPLEGPRLVTPSKRNGMLGPISNNNSTVITPPNNNSTTTTTTTNANGTSPKPQQIVSDGKGGFTLVDIEPSKNSYDNIVTDNTFSNSNTITPTPQVNPQKIISDGKGGFTLSDTTLSKNSYDDVTIDNTLKTKDNLFPNLTPNNNSYVWNGNNNLIKEEVKEVINADGSKSQVKVTTNPNGTTTEKVISTDSKKDTDIKDADKKDEVEIDEKDIEEYEDDKGDIVRAPYHGNVKTYVPHETRKENEWNDNGRILSNSYKNPDGSSKVVNYTRYIDSPSDDVTYSFNDLGRDVDKVVGNVFNTGRNFVNSFRTERRERYNSPRNKENRSNGKEVTDDGVVKDKVIQEPVNNMPFERIPSQKQQRNDYIRQLASDKLANPSVSQLPNLTSTSMARKYEREVDKQKREMNRAENNIPNSSVNNNKIVRINDRVDSRFNRPEEISPTVPIEVTPLTEEEMKASLSKNINNNLLTKKEGGLIKAQFGKYVPFDVANPETYNPKKQEPLVGPMLLDQPKTEITNNTIKPTYNFEQAKDVKNLNEIYDAIPVSNMSFYDPYGNSQTKTETKTNSNEFLYDPKKLHIYGDRLQHRANMLPLKYNVFKSLFDKPEVQNPIYNKQDVTSLQGLRRNQIAPNMNPLVDARAANNQAIRDTGRGSGQIINSLQASHNNTQKGMNEELYRIKNANQSQQNLYLQQLDRIGNTRREIDTKVNEDNRQHRLAFDKFQRDAIESGEKMMINKGQLHNQELEDHIKLTGYINQIASDYKFVNGPNGVPYIEYTGKTNGKKVSMPLGTFKSFLSGQTGVEHPETTEEKKKRVASGARSYDANGKPISNKQGGYVPRKRKTF